MEHWVQTPPTARVARSGSWLQGHQAPWQTPPPLPCRAPPKEAARQRQNGLQQLAAKLALAEGAAARCTQLETSLAETQEGVRGQRQLTAELEQWRPVEDLRQVKEALRAAEEAISYLTQRLQQAEQRETQNRLLLERAEVQEHNRAEPKVEESHRCGSFAPLRESHDLPRLWPRKRRSVSRPKTVATRMWNEIEQQLRDVREDVKALKAKAPEETSTHSGCASSCEVEAPWLAWQAHPSQESASSATTCMNTGRRRSGPLVVDLTGGLDPVSWRPEEPLVHIMKSAQDSSKTYVDLLGD